MCIYIYIYTHTYIHTYKYTYTYTYTYAYTYTYIHQKGEGKNVPKKGSIIEIHYVASVCTTDEAGNYDLSEREGDPEIYPNLPQVLQEDTEMRQKKKTRRHVRRGIMWCCII